MRSPLPTSAANERPLARGACHRWRLPPATRPHPRLPASNGLYLRAAPKSREESVPRYWSVASGEPEEWCPDKQQAGRPQSSPSLKRRTAGPGQRPSPPPNKRASHSALPAARTAHARRPAAQHDGTYCPPKTTRPEMLRATYVATLCLPGFQGDLVFKLQALGKWS